MSCTRILSATGQSLEKNNCLKQEHRMSMNSSRHYPNVDGQTKTRGGFFLAILMMLFAIPWSTWAQVGNFASFDVPGATLTVLNDVNNSGVIVGRYNDQNGAHGFVLNQSVVATIDFPGAV